MPAINASGGYMGFMNGLPTPGVSGSPYGGPRTLFDLGGFGNPAQQQPPQAQAQQTNPLSSHYAAPGGSDPSQLPGWGNIAGPIAQAPAPASGGAASGGAPSSTPNTTPQSWGGGAGKQMTQSPGVNYVGQRPQYNANGPTRDPRSTGWGGMPVGPAAGGAPGLAGYHPQPAPTPPRFNNFAGAAPTAPAAGPANAQANNAPAAPQPKPPTPAPAANPLAAAYGSPGAGSAAPGTPAWYQQQGYSSTPWTAQAGGTQPMWTDPATGNRMAQGQFPDQFDTNPANIASRAGAQQDAQNAGQAYQASRQNAPVQQPAAGTGTAPLGWGLDQSGNNIHGAAAVGAPAGWDPNAQNNQGLPLQQISRTGVFTSNGGGYAVPGRRF